MEGKGPLPCRKPALGQRKLALLNGMSGTRGLHTDPVHMTAGAMADMIYRWHASPEMRFGTFFCTHMRIKRTFSRSCQCYTLVR